MGTELGHCIAIPIFAIHRLQYMTILDGAFYNLVQIVENSNFEIQQQYTSVPLLFEMHYPYSKA